MKHYVKPECKQGCRFIQISDELWLCPHAAFGAASYYKGAIDEARALLERSGGYDAVLTRLEQKEGEARAAAREKRETKQRRMADSVRYD